MFLGSNMVQYISLCHFFWLNKIPLCISFLFIHPPLVGHLSCLYLLAIMCVKLIEISVYKCLRGHGFLSLGHIPRSGTAGSHDAPVFNFSRNCPSVSIGAAPNTVHSTPVPPEAPISYILANCNLKFTVCLFDYRYTSRYDDISLWFDLHFPLR